MESQSKLSSVKIAEFLLKIQAIQLRPSQPFTWASGWKSPIYCDNRIALSYPEIRSEIKVALADIIGTNYGMPDAIAGVATAAIAQGALVADLLELPFVYVRSSAKEHGRGNQIEGEIKPGQSVVVIEDLISTGQSSLKAVEALRNAGANVLGMAAIFSYGFALAAENFTQANCKLVTLSDYETMIEIAAEKDYINAQHLTTLKDWRNNPAQWGQNL